MKISALIIDDELLARKVIKNLLNNVPEIEISGQCKTGTEAINMIDELKPDLIFLDIKLKDMTGFDVLDRISIKTPIVIFVTAFDSYAIKAFDFFAFDYLLKPFNESRFYKSIDKVIDSLSLDNTNLLQKKIEDLLIHMSSNHLKTKQLNKNKLPIPSRNKTIFICPEDIQYITASNYYVEIYTQKEKYLLRDSMGNLTDKLPTTDFIRIHRSTIINIDYVIELINSNHGEIDVKMKDMKQHRVSKSYKKDFLLKMGVNR